MVMVMMMEVVLIYVTMTIVMIMEVLLYVDGGLCTQSPISSLSRFPFNGEPSLTAVLTILLIFIAQYCPSVDVNALDQDNHPVLCAVCFLYLQVSLLTSEDDTEDDTGLCCCFLLVSLFSDVCISWTPMLVSSLCSRRL